MISSVTRLTMFDGIEKPTPIEPDWPPADDPPAEAIATLMPMRLPFGVDESAARVARVDGGVGLDHGDLDRLAGLGLGLAALTEVEEERRSLLVGCWSGVLWSPSVPLSSLLSGAADEAISIERLSALTMPVVTVFDRPSGAPTAIVASPTLRSTESPNSIGREARGVLELDDREVVGRVGADDLGVVDVSVRRRDADGGVAGRTVEGDDVGVGDDVAVLGEDDARAGAGGAAA